MSLSVPHKQEPANDNAGERCPHCGLRHAGLSPAELEQLARQRRFDESDSDAYEFCRPGLGWLGRSFRGLPGVCPVALSPLEKALLFQARRTSALLALAHERPALAPTVALIIERCALGLGVSELEPLSRAKPTADDVAVIYEAARLAALELRGDGFDESTVRSRVAASLAQLRRVARFRALDESEWPHKAEALEAWFREARKESARFGRWIQRTLPDYMRAASERKPSGRSLAGAITEQYDDKSRAHVDCPFPGFRTMRARGWTDEKTPSQQLAEEQLASAIVFEARREATPAVDNAASW